MRRRIEKITEAFAKERGVPSVLLRWDDNFAVDPIASPKGDLALVLEETVAAFGRPAIEYGPSTGTSDMRHFVNCGMPCFLFGPGRGYNPHRANEHYHLADLPNMVTMMLEIIRRWCA
jgi:acetylornithine deacetylase/succinyl-diaminopimelate desuccinylase-like protein